MLVVEQPDGTLAQVPEWMCSPVAAGAVIRDAPRLPLDVLQALRLVADAALLSLADGHDGGRDGTRPTIPTTRPVRVGDADGRPAAGGAAPGAAVARGASAGGDDGRDTGAGGER